MIVFNIDVMLARRKMSLTELSERVGITMANLSILKTGKAKAVGGDAEQALPRFGLSAWRSVGVPAGRGSLKESERDRRCCAAPVPFFGGMRIIFPNKCCSTPP